MKQGLIKAGILVRQISRIASDLFINKWVAYGTILLLQWCRISGIWNYRDLTPGDTSSYFQDAYDWYARGKLLISLAPLYTAFYGSLLHLYDDVFFATTLHRVLIVLTIAVLFLAVMRRLLPLPVAWLMSAWWVLLPINFDSLYELHLFALIPLLVASLLLAGGSIYKRGAAVGVLLASAFLVRNEQILVVIVLVLVLLVLRQRSPERVPAKRLAIAYAIPVLFALLLTYFFFTRAKDRGSAFYDVAGVKHTLNVCQAFAFGYQQRHPEWSKSPWTECESLMMQEFGKPQVSYFEAFRRKPTAILEHMLWNLTLAPNGLQIMLFNATSGTMNPDYVPIHAGSTRALLATLALLSLWISGLVVLIRNWRFWWDTWLAPRRWAWLGVISPFLMTFVVLLTQRPRPSYLFSLTVLMIAVTGLFLFVVSHKFRFGQVLEVTAPIIAIVLLLGTRSYYPRPSVDQPRVLYESYRNLISYRPLLRLPATVFLTPSYTVEVCNYVGLGEGNCNGLNYWELRKGIQTSEQWPTILASRKVNVLYADQSVLSDALRPQLLTDPSSAGWEVAGQQHIAGRNWLLLRKLRPAGDPTLTVAPQDGAGYQATFEFVRDRVSVGETTSMIAIINGTFVAANSCYVSHDKGTKVISLSSDDTKSWMPVTSGSTESAQNGQCVLNGHDSSIESTPTSETMRVSLTFKPNFAGDKTIYGCTRGRSGLSVEWAPLGTWRVTRKSRFGF